MATLTQLRAASIGWDGPQSQPLHPEADANYSQWLTTVPLDRSADAEPLLTDDGHIRLEWSVGDESRIAEIGPSSLYLCLLAAGRSNDDSEDYDTFDGDALARFFNGGGLR